MRWNRGVGAEIGVGSRRDARQQVFVRLLAACVSCLFFALFVRFCLCSGSLVGCDVGLWLVSVLRHK